jgi:hypothetical protein
VEKLLAKEQWRNRTIKAPIRPILIWDGDPYGYVGPIYIKEIFSSERRVSCEALLRNCAEKERTNIITILKLHYSY